MKTLPSLIGIAGRAGSGKDTLAAHLVSKYGFIRYGFADPIKRLLNERFGWENSEWEDREWKETPNERYGQRWIGSENGKYGRPDRDFFESFSPREWAQWLGTEVGRNTFGEDCWVGVFERWYKGLTAYRAPEQGIIHVVIPDVRFENEAKFIHRLGGEIVQIIRPGVKFLDPFATTHVSESGLPDRVINHYLANQKNIPYLLKSFDALYDETLA